jgi:hypothetical protein
LLAPRRRTRRFRALYVFLIFSFSWILTNLSWAQGARVRPELSEQQESDKDRPLAREQWLRLGRSAISDSAAALRYKAYQQKMLLRAQRLKPAAPRTSAQTGSTTTASSTTAASASATTAIWTPLGPTPILSDPSGAQSYGFVSGRATRVLVDQTDPTGNTVYLGGAYGGLWKSTNAAAANAGSVVWTPLIDDQPTLAVGAMAISPANNNLLLVGTGEPNSSGDSYYGLGILRSTDGGASWNLVTSGDGGTHPFKGLGFSHIVFSSSNPNLVVAASAATNGSQLGATGPNSIRGLYSSADAGVTWSYASILDGSTVITPGSATAVVYNAALQRFFAAVRYHGVYSSADGAHWSRLSAQPGGSLLNPSACSPSTNSNCPLYRGELAIVLGSATMFLWIVDNTDTNRGMFSTSDGGATWTSLDVTGINSCGDATGCGSSQGGYNLTLAAVPVGGGIDLYAGAVNLFKCSMSSPGGACTGAWKNLTHVYGCTPLAKPSHVHPDQHDIGVSQGNSSVMYFANDGGIYRTLNAAGLTSGSCSTANPFDNLNGSLGSMTEFVSFSEGTDSETLLGGTQDNGSPATTSVHSTATWTEVNSGDGGFNAINPDNPQQWLTANTDVSIQRCDSGFSCDAAAFPVTVGPPQVGDDHGDFYTPYILDPQLTDNVIVGTCRVWRGPSDGVGWSASNALSGSLTGDTLPCSGTGTQVIRSLAAGGPADAGGSQVIYAGTSSGQIYVSSNATGATPTFNQANISVLGFPISDIAMDPSDPSGMTAWASVMGFGVGHVFRTHNGTSWQNVSANLPDAPANSVVVDPGDPSSVYVGTDVGVFFTHDGGTTWAEYGPSSGSGFLPSTPVTRLRIFLGSTPRKLRASTYGRGVWETDLSAVVPGFALATSLPSIAVFRGQTASFKGILTSVAGYSSAVNVKCTGVSVPPTCSGGSFVPTAQGTAFSLTAASPAIGDLGFTIAATGTDPSSTTRQSAAMLRVVDFSLQPLPSEVSVNAGLMATISGINLTALGSFDSNVTVTCESTTLPAGASCSSSTAMPTANSPASTSVTLTVPSATAPGAYAIALLATSDAPAGARMQTFTLNVLAPGTADFAITDTPAGTTTINSGQSVTYNINVSPQGAAFNNTVALSCGTLPPQATCTFTQTNVTPGAGGVSTNLTISTGTIARAQAAPAGISPWLALWLAVPLAGIVTSSRHARGRRISMLLLSFALAATMHIACGGGSGATSATNAVVKSGTPPGPYTVTVQGTSGSLTHTATVSFVVN